MSKVRSLFYIHYYYSIFFIARRPYTSPKFIRQHFCSFQKPPCVRNECRVATQIIAGLYPLNFSKFLVTSYQPLNEEERKGLLHIHHIYLTFLVRKLCTVTNKPICLNNMNEVLLDVDDSDHLLLCDIGSAIAECYLTEATVQVVDALEACFECSGFDIRLDMAWLDALYLSKDKENAGASLPLNGTTMSADDPKLQQLKEISPHMDQLFFDKPNMQKALIKNEDIIKMGELCGEGGSAGFEQLTSNLIATVTSAEAAFGVEAAAGPVMCCENEDCAAGTNKAGEHLAEAIKLAVNQKLNL